MTKSNEGFGEGIIVQARTADHPGGTGSEIRYFHNSIELLFAEVEAWMTLAIAQRVRGWFGGLGGLFRIATGMFRMINSIPRFYVNSYQASFFKKWTGILKGISSTGRYLHSTTHLTLIVRATKSERCDPTNCR
jgi:hypothetical protein